MIIQITHKNTSVASSQSSRTTNYTMKNACLVYHPINISMFFGAKVRIYALPKRYLLIPAFDVQIQMAVRRDPYSMTPFKSESLQYKILSIVNSFISEYFQL